MAILTVCLAANLAMAQAPAPPAAPKPPAPLPGATEDPNGYKLLPPSPTLLGNTNLANTVKGQVRRVLQGAPLSDSRVVFDNYYTKFYFPLMTQTNDKALEELPVERQRLFRDLESCKSQETHNHLINLTLDAMLPIVQDNFHPAVRYNAMLIIGSLNDREAVKLGSTPSVPEPMLRALPVILAEFTKLENPAGIRVAALIGICRHLEWDNYRVGGPAIAAGPKATITKTLMDVATAKEPPAGLNAEAHQWFRRRAIEGLANAGYLKAEQPVVDAMDKLLRDETESLPVRCAAAAAIGKMAYQAPIKLDPAPTAKELGYLALVACDTELNRVTNLRKQEDERQARLAGTFGQGEGGYGEGGLPGGGRMPGGEGGGYRMPGPARQALPGGFGEGGFGGEGTGEILPEDAKQYRFDHVRRQIRSQLHSIQIAFTAGEERVKAGTTPPPSPNTPGVRGLSKMAKAQADVKYVADVLTGIDNLAKTVEYSTTDLAALEKDLRKVMRPLEAITRKVGAAPAAAPSDVPGGVAPPAGPAPPPGPGRPATGTPAAATTPAVRPAAATPAAATPVAAAPR